MTCPAVCPTNFLVFARVRCVVGGNHLNCVVIKCFPKCDTMMIFDRIRKSVRAKPFHIVPCREEQRPVVNFATYVYTLFSVELHEFDTTNGLHMNEVQLCSSCFRHSQQCANCGVPNYAVTCGVCLCVSLWAAIATGPILLLDRGDDCLVVRMHHEWQTGWSDCLKHPEKMPFVHDSAAGRMGIITTGVDHHEYLECCNASFSKLRYLRSVARQRVVVPVDDRL